MAFDRKGNATWQCLDETGTFHPDVDTQRFKALGADLRCKGEPAPIEALDHDPDNRSPLPRSSEFLPKRRSLYHLRRLSEEINAAEAKKDRKR